MLKNLNIDKTWTLFLDRDGVINKTNNNDYIAEWEQFVFQPDVMDALKKLSGIFGKIIIVTNQEGIGKGMITEESLSAVHEKMLEEIRKNGGKIDKIYFSRDEKKYNNTRRKPNIHMAVEAKKDFPEIDFKKSVMVGDSITDMEFGFKMKMNNVFLCDDTDAERNHDQLINYTFNNLFEFSQSL